MTILKNIVSLSASKNRIMIENVKFEEIGQGQSQIILEYSTGEETELMFNSIFPIQAKSYYLKSIKDLLKHKPDLSPKDDLFTLFSNWFWKCHLEAPLGIGAYRDENRIRLGRRIKELRIEKGLDAKQLAILCGIDAANLCRIEQGKRSVGIDILSKIVNALGFQLDFVKL